MGRLCKTYFFVGATVFKDGRDQEVAPTKGDGIQRRSRQGGRSYKGRRYSKTVATRRSLLQRATVFKDGLDKEVAPTKGDGIQRRSRPGGRSYKEGVTLQFRQIRLRQVFEATRAIP